MLLKRQDWSTAWQSVTGSLLEGEDKMTGAWRELMEETALGPSHGTLIDQNCKNWFEIYPKNKVRYPSGITQNLEHIFIFEMHGMADVHICQEHSEWAWFSKDEALNKVRSWTNRLAIDLYQCKRRRKYGRT